MDVKDIVEIQQVAALYGHAADAATGGDLSLLPKVFAEDATFDCRSWGGTDYYVGLDEITAWFALGNPPHPYAHFLTNCYVYEEDGQVRAKSKLFFRYADGTIFMGDYNDIMVRTADGWRVRTRVATPRDLGRAAI